MLIGVALHPHNLFRFYQNNFEDAARQDAIDLLLNQHERLSSYGLRLAKDQEYAGGALAEPSFETTASLEEKADLAGAGSLAAGSLRVWYGTWNIGGRGLHEPLDPWLFPEKSELPTADLYVMAIQELVELTSVRTGMRVLLSQNDRDKELQLEQTIKSALGPCYVMASHL